MEILRPRRLLDSVQNHPTKCSLKISFLCALLLLCAFSRTSKAQTSVPTTPITPSYFGLTVVNSEITPILQYGTVRSWDTWPHPDWSDANPSLGVYKFGQLDTFMTANAGRDMIYTLGRTPQWASSQPNVSTPYGPGQCAPPANMSYWDDYLTAIVTHAAGRIKYWELWNEPQNTSYYCGDIPTMVVLAQHAYSIIKSIDPSAVILSPAVTSAAGPAWLNTFLADGGSTNIDVIAFHGYWDGVAEDLATVIGRYQTVMATNGVSQLPMWDTEASDGTAQPGFLSKYYLLHWSMGASRFLWYSYDGDAIWGQLWNPATGVASPSATAYAQTYNWLVGATLGAPCAAGTNGVWTCIYYRQGYTGNVLWNSNATVTVTVPSQFIQYRDLTGAVYPITGGTVSVGNNPIIIETATTNVPTLTFNPIPTPTYGNSFAVSATSGSTGAITYSLVSGPATISGSIVTPNGIGTIVLSATQAAAGYYTASLPTTTSITVAPAVPTLSFAPMATQTYGSPFAVSATSPSNGAFTYSVVSGPATISGSTVTPTGTGTVVLGATQAASGNYAATTTVTTTSVTIGTEVPTITFPTFPSETYGKIFSVKATSPSGGWITYSAVTGQATVSGYNVVPNVTGTIVVTASQAAAGNYAAGTATTSINVLPAVPTLSFAAVPSQTYGNGPVSVSATSQSDGAMSYAVVRGPATISGSTVTPTGVGTVVLSATQAASGYYAAGTTTTSFAVAAEVPTLSFAAIASQNYGNAPFAVNASSASSGYVTYTVASGPATVAGYTVTLTGTGTVVLNASQAAAGNYATTTATTSFTVGAAAPALTFAAIPSPTYGSPFAVSATSVAPGPVTYSVLSGPATVSGSTVTPTGIGAVVLSATKAASANYAAATATTSVTIAGAAPTLTFPTIPTQTYGKIFSAKVTSPSGGWITYTVANGQGTVAGYSVTPTATGTILVTASQAAVGNYAAATATTSVNVVGMAPTLSFTTVPAQTYGNAPFAVSASSASSGAVTYTVVSGPATISGSTVNFTGLGTVVLSASQAATNNYAAATATTKFTVTGDVPTLTFAAVGTQTYGKSFPVKATSPSGGWITYTASSGQATISGYNIIPTVTGTILVTATQAAVGNYAAATATISVNVVAATPTLSFTAIPSQTYGNAPITVSATSVSNGAVSYTVVSGPATISGSKVTLTGAGTVVLSASQAATSNYAAATTTIKFTVAS